MSEQNTLHWRLKLKTGDSVLWYPHGIVNLVEQPVPGTWRVSGAALVGIVSAPEHDLRPLPGTRYTMVSGPVDEAVQPVPVLTTEQYDELKARLKFLWEIAEMRHDRVLSAAVYDCWQLVNDAGTAGAIAPAEG